ncbi:condensation domain-containing protein [Rhodococcoides yunnanense]|uniref:Condensation domain-containing protein n=1 Tax=Rhodococcoides yunnanense TaxID=278209 RepID=A0ABU4BG91_9NOCA|nr:condensation domain-containing protein [Rhodococcus yunnanensis]MDV6263234.1 condensation domain-containing protein [Rhodococcus yunnanensis]
MIITAMGSWNPAPGRLLEWHPTPAAQARAATAPVDSTPPSFLQEDHLKAAWAARQRGDVHTAYTGVATEIDGDVDTAAMSRALAAYVLRHEGLRCWFEVESTGVVRHLAEPEVAEFEAVDAGESTDDDEFQRYVRRRFSTEATADVWPGFVIGVVSRPGSFTLYYGADHAFTDGGSQALVISELADLYALEIGGRAPKPAEAGSHLAYAAEERARAATYGPDSPEITAWRDIFTRHDGSMPRFPLDLGLAPGERAPVRIVERHLLDAGEVAAFDAACKAAGARMSSGIFAAVGITDFELAGTAEYFGITVLSTRHHGDYGQSQGWFVNFAPVAFEVAGNEKFSDVAALAHSGFEQAKQIAEAPVHAVLGALAADGTLGSELAVSPNMLSYIDFRWFPGVGRAADTRAKHFTGEGSTSNASMWINRDGEHLYLVAQTPDTDTAATSVERYHAHLAHVLETIAREGNYVLSLDHLVQEPAGAGHLDH